MLPLRILRNVWDMLAEREIVELRSWCIARAGNEGPRAATGPTIGIADGAATSSCGKSAGRCPVGTPVGRDRLNGR